MKDWIKYLDLCEKCEKASDDEIVKIVIENKEKGLFRYIKDPDKILYCASIILDEENFFEELINVGISELFYKYRNKLSEQHKLYALCNVDDDELKINSLDEVNDNDKFRLLITIKNNEFKFNYLNKIKESYQREMILETITNDTLLMNYYKNAGIFEKIVIATSLQNDENKMNILNDFDYYDKIRIIKSMSDEKKLEFLNDDNYKNNYADIALSIKNNNLKRKYFFTNEDEEFRISFVDKINNYFMMRDYVPYLKNNKHKDIAISNLSHEKMIVLAIHDYEEKNYNIDPNMTFNIKMDIKNKDYKNIRNFSRILNNWKIEDNDNKLTITSPSLLFNNDNMRELSYMCEFLKNLGFYYDKECSTYIYIYSVKHKINIDKIDFNEIISTIENKINNNEQKPKEKNKIKSLFLKKYFKR